MIFVLNSIPMLCKCDTHTHTHTHSHTYTHTLSHTHTHTHTHTTFRYLINWMSMFWRNHKSKQCVFSWGPLDQGNPPCCQIGIKSSQEVICAWLRNVITLFCRVKKLADSGEVYVMYHFVKILGSSSAEVCCLFRRLLQQVGRLSAIALLLLYVNVYIYIYIYIYISCLPTSENDFPICQSISRFPKVCHHYKYFVIARAQVTL